MVWDKNSTNRDMTQSWIMNMPSVAMESLFGLMEALLRVIGSMDKLVELVCIVLLLLQQMFMKAFGSRIDRPIYASLDRALGLIFNRTLMPLSLSQK